MKRQNLRTVSLVVVTFTYLLIGAAIFGYLESDHEFRQREALELIELIIRRKYNITEDDWTVLTTTVIKSVPHKAGIQWKFPGAFYFATTVVTTIGYGHSTPSTVSGRSFCMAYALIGIPLGLVMFQSIGERLNTFVGAALRWAKRFFKLKNPEVTVTNLVMVVSVLSTILMTSMAAVFAKYERWDYFDALYYCFITLTTIGFGDYVALQKDSALQSKPEYVILSLVFILFGLSVVSSAVNLLVLKFLTLNTEDERRDEQLRNTAAMNPIQLEGDVITSSAGKFEYVGGARRQPPALTMSQAMARSSIKRDREALLAASWQRPTKRAQLRQQQVPPQSQHHHHHQQQQQQQQTQTQVIGRLQSIEATGSDSDSVILLCDSPDETVAGFEPGQKGDELRYCNVVATRKHHLGEQAPASSDLQTLDERWHETTASLGRGQDDNSDASDGQNDSDGRLVHLSNLQAPAGLVCCGAPLEHELDYYLHERQLDRGRTSTCCQCRHYGDSAPSAASIRISSAKTTTIISPVQDGEWTDAERWASQSTPERMLPGADQLATCYPNMANSGTAGTTKDVDSLSMGAGGPTMQFKPLAAGYQDRQPGQPGEAGGRQQPAACMSRSSSSLASSATRPPGDALELAILAGVDQQQSPLNSQPGSQASSKANSCEPVQVHRQRHPSSSHKTGPPPAGDNCNCDDGNNADSRPSRELGAQISRSGHSQRRRKCLRNRHEAVSERHSIEAHHRQGHKTGQHASSPPPNRVIDRAGQQAGPSQMAATTPAANQSSCSCSWVSLASPCGSPAGGRVAGIRPLNTPTYGHDSCLVLDPESLQSSDCNRHKCATRAVHRQRSAGSGRRKPSAGLVASEHACPTTATRFQSSPAFHGSGPQSGFLVGDAAPTGHNNHHDKQQHHHHHHHHRHRRHRQHQNDAKIMISPRQEPVLRRRSATDDGQDYGGRPQIQARLESASLCPLQGINSNNEDEPDEDLAGRSEIAQNASGDMQSETTPAALSECRCVNSKLGQQRHSTTSGCAKQTSSTTPVRRESSSSSSQKQVRVARLVCRCCCQHAECIEYALGASCKRHGSPPPLGCDAAGKLLAGNAKPCPQQTTTTFQKSAPEANCDKTRTGELSPTKIGSLSDLDRNNNTAHGDAPAECGQRVNPTTLAKHGGGGGSG